MRNSIGNWPSTPLFVLGSDARSKRRSRIGKHHRPWKTSTPTRRRPTNWCSQSSEARTGWSTSCGTVSRRGKSDTADCGPASCLRLTGPCGRSNPESGDPGDVEQLIARLRARRPGATTATASPERCASSPHRTPFARPSRISNAKELVEFVRSPLHRLRRHPGANQIAVL